MCITCITSSRRLSTSSHVCITQDSADPMESVELLVESVQKAFQPIHAVSARVCPPLAYCISAVYLGCYH
jgi:hypothetical protein